MKHFVLLALAVPLYAQSALTWEQVRSKFEATNPTLRAAQINIDESRAAEITAYLRPNPDFSLTADGLQISRNNGVWRPLNGVVVTPGFSYLHERKGKRELRLETATLSTDVAGSTYSDQERGLMFNLRTAFVQTLQAKAVLDNARENLAYWDRELGVNRTRFNAGDLAQVDLERLELQRVQFESDFETAYVSLRTAKIQLLMLLNERTPLEKFDVTGAFDFAEEFRPLEEFRNIALETRPDLKAAVQNVALAKANHQLAIANGSTDPTFGIWYSHNPSFSNPYANETMGGSISIPLRIFDRNQGEKARTQLDISRNERLQDATEAQVFSDVDSAYWAVIQNVNLLKPYKSKYLPLATEVRDRMSFSYQNGGASLLDFLDAEKSYRDTRLAYLNLVGAYLTAAAQMNQAVGREVMQ
ncbi:MAG: TolC family protein [Bryobacterales bacterium]|nr:TolC family protein [Bryobacterales bacterium]MBV9398779.1 TolC family protein [Bryobacterales bacterium]